MTAIESKEYVQKQNCGFFNFLRFILRIKRIITWKEVLLHPFSLMDEYKTLCFIAKKFSVPTFFLWLKGEKRRGSYLMLRRISQAFKDRRGLNYKSEMMKALGDI